MGIYSRDYIREDNSGGSRFRPGGSEWAIKYLLIANIAVFLLQQFSPAVDDWLALRLSVQTASEGAKFFLQTQSSEHDATETIPPHTSVELLGTGKDTRTGKPFWLINWKGREGFVPAESMQIDVLGSYHVLWQLVTYGFCHGGLMHIAFNMYILWMFGRLLEPIYGSREFLAIFLVGVVVSGLFHILYQAIQHTPIGAIGASGGVMAVVFLTAMHFPRLTVLLMFVIPLEMRWLAVMYAVVDVLGLVNPGSGVAHAAHLGGAAFGLAYKYYGWNLLGTWSRLRGGWRMPRLRRRPKVRLYDPAGSESPRRQPDLDARVDRILEKISRDGETSLTDEERALLKEASQRYKGR